jgi:hypothetical protein
MMSSEHFIKKCRGCKKVIARCRCADPNKVIQWGICEECAKKNEKKE